LSAIRICLIAARSLQVSAVAGVTAETPHWASDIAAQLPGAILSKEVAAFRCHKLIGVETCLAIIGAWRQCS
jgi:hypothetical protein